VDVFEALADPVRRSLLRRLRSGPSRVVDLAAAHDVSRPAVSRHLRHLTETGLVQVTDRGRERHYALRPEGLDPVLELVARLQPEAGEPPVGEQHLDALETEVRRTSRERRRDVAATAPHEESA
jgi:DNA-binding transcriptional ArsR family regulator